MLAVHTMLCRKCSILVKYEKISNMVTPFSQLTYSLTHLY